ncbi:BTB/POZ domain-containing protein 6-A-like [Paramacrobiotus metropolitanus]|uniref:BTB/POZ domain-containing protein 6-A-like n=1 Tax=Paramacrobiotus metropolitanus TaxID=2943436 RepID=UPI0024457B25|nr:BTB/POZ domain-containing protein 6-A-like [Paramacrobiotus metropolitanus]
MTQPSASFVSSERRGAIAQITNRYQNALASSDLTDVEFAVGRQCGEVKKIRAHRLILSLGSDVFHTMFNGSLAERGDAAIDIPDIPPDAFTNMLNYIYTGSVDDIKQGNALQTVYCAEKYDLPWLSELCTDFVLDQVKPDNCLMYLENALRWTPNCDHVLDKCWDVVDASTEAVLESGHFTKINQTQLEMLLRRGTLSAKENAVYLAVERWATAACDRKNVDHKSSNRRRMLGPTLSFVRFPLMTDAQLVDGPIQSGLLNDEEVRKLYTFKHSAKSFSASWLLGFSVEPRKNVMHPIGSRSYKQGEKIFISYTNGFWHPVKVKGEQTLECLSNYAVEKVKEKNEFAAPTQTVRAADILKRGRPVYAYIGEVYKEATYGSQRAGRHTVSVAGRECSVQFKELRIADKHVEEWKAAQE